MSSTASRAAWVQIAGAIGGRGDLGDSDLGVDAVRFSAVREDDDAVRIAQAKRILFLYDALRRRSPSLHSRLRTGLR